jgi:predicted lipoprotein
MFPQGADVVERVQVRPALRGTSARDGRGGTHGGNVRTDEYWESQASMGYACFDMRRMDKVMKRT